LDSVGVRFQEICPVTLKGVADPDATVPGCAWNSGHVRKFASSDPPPPTVPDPAHSRTWRLTKASPSWPAHCPGRYQSLYPASHPFRIRQPA